MVNLKTWVYTDTAVYYSTFVDVGRTEFFRTNTKFVFCNNESIFCLMVHDTGSVQQFLFFAQQLKQIFGAPYQAFYLSFNSN